MSTIRSATIGDEVLSSKVDAAIRGMVIKEKIEEIDNYISDKVYQDNSKDITPGAVTASV